MNIEEQLRNALRYRYAKSILHKSEPVAKWGTFRLEKKRLAEVMNVTTETLQKVLDKIYEDGGICKDDGQMVDFKKEYIWSLGAPKYFD